ncbi:GFA family protein [Paucibacter sp. B2R-40]|uniref:GFA family protein n=1 Tax=Paucibacter sp. B2R-40 TaxID=2893554 RepID=UPI0021E47514|nr:GFA family protein [Paucibacter sp. B2R-40]MCV2352703.1 GFA family protein [Paucibacter sp. B2R-40]
MTATETSDLLASCYCGAVGLHCEANPKSVIHCHCQQCRRLSGAAFTTWLSLPREATVVSGRTNLQQFAPSENGLRHFCMRCGTHVFTEDRRFPDILGVPAGILSSALTAQPSSHYFVSNKATWHACHDDLPKFGGLSGFERIDLA